MGSVIVGDASVVDGGAASWFDVARERGRPQANRGGVLRLDAEVLAELVADRVTPIGWFASGELRLEHATIGELMNWWLVLRAAIDGTTPHLPGDIDLTGPDGEPLDLHRSFTVDDDPAEMAAFLRAIRETAPVTVSQPASTVAR